MRRAASIILIAQSMAAGNYVARASLSQAEYTVRTIRVNHTAPVQLSNVELVLAQGAKLRVVLGQCTNMSRMSGMASCDPLGITGWRGGLVPSVRVDKRFHVGYIFGRDNQGSRIATASVSLVLRYFPLLKIRKSVHTVRGKSLLFLLLFLAA
eukprot:COSAG01_NODE_3274_length_6319_cov_22.538585_1_plen_153_part_00